jgi:hypothetical protein
LQEAYRQALVLARRAYLADLKTARDKYERAKKAALEEYLSGLQSLARGSATTTTKPMVSPPTTTITTGVTFTSNTAPSTVLTNSTMTMLRFTATAGPLRDASFQRLKFKASVNGRGTLSTPTLRSIATTTDLSTTTATIESSGSTCGFTATSGELCIVLDLAAPQTVAAGASATYDLRLTASGFTSGSSVTITMLNVAGDIHQTVVN